MPLTNLIVYTLASRTHCTPRVTCCHYLIRSHLFHFRQSFTHALICTFHILCPISFTFNISYSTFHILIHPSHKPIMFFSLQKVPRYLTNYKNPCWYDPPSPNGALSCLPYFYLLGVGKCGTSTFFKNIQKHPDIYMGRTKEMHYWDHISKSKLFIIQATNVIYYIYLMMNSCFVIG